MVCIPFVGIVMKLVLGVHGNEWAWRNKEWASLDEFIRVQRNWARAAGIFFGILGIGVVLALLPMIAFPFS